MPAVTIPTEKSNVTRNQEMRDYSNDLFFKKKAEKAAAFIKKWVN